MVKKRRHRPKRSFARRWISFTRVFRYGAENFVRNAWLSLAAILIMTITLLIIFLAVASNNILKDTVNSIRDRVQMSIYVKNTIDEITAQQIKHDIEKIPGVSAVEYISSAQARKDITNGNVDDKGFIDAINEAKNKLPSTYRVKITDINDPSKLENYTKDNDLIKKWLDPKQPPSFSSSSRTAIDNIAKHANFAEKAGVAVAVIFTAVAALVVFNTIRMAIFNRKDEIYMMRLIGAEPSFVRSPFVVEAVLNGVISAIIATSTGLVLFDLAKDKISSYGVEITQTIEFATKHWYLVYGVMIGAGILIGIFSSFLATGKYLKEKHN